MEMDEQPQSPPSRATWSLLGVWFFLATASAVGAAFAPYLLVNYPALLLATSPLPRHLLLVAPVLDPTVFFALGFARRLLAAIVVFAIGWKLGPRAVAWVEARWPRIGAELHRLERVFGRVGPVLVLLPSITIWLLAGTLKMRVALFIPLAAFGGLGLLIGVFEFAEWFAAPLATVIAWVRAYVWEATLVCVAIVSASQLPRLITFVRRYGRDADRHAS